MALEHHAEAAVARLEIVDDASVDADLARGRILEAGDHAQRRGLAAAGRPDEDDELAVLDGEAQVPDRDDGAEGLVQIAQLDARHILSPYHAEAEAAREMLADDEADDHQRNRDADRERRLAAVDAAFGRALILRQLDRQRGRPASW